MIEARYGTRLKTPAQMKPKPKRTPEKRLHDAFGDNGRETA
jgi:hypothetical protein